MSLAEVKDSIQKMTVEQRPEVAAFIAHLNRAGDLDYQAELDRRMLAMDAGQKVSEAEVARLHDELSRRGQ